MTAQPLGINLQPQSFTGLRIKCDPIAVGARMKLAGKFARDSHFLRQRRFVIRRRNLSHHRCGGEPDANGIGRTVRAAQSVLDRVQSSLTRSDRLRRRQQLRLFRICWQRDIHHQFFKRLAVDEHVRRGCASGQVAAV
ncbi:MAG: hypothetical protein JW388_1048 [Nitrospira sp.]|nr:hypothetical protein [Nitrospira sp.]